MLDRSEKIYGFILAMIAGIASIFAIAVNALDLGMKGGVQTWAILGISIMVIIACGSFLIWSAIRPDRSNGKAIAEQVIPEPIAVDREAVIQEMVEALALSNSLYGRKKDSGHEGWVHEDLIRLSTTYLALIKRYASLDSTPLRRALDVEKIPRDQIDAKKRMLEYHGILESLRDEWKAGHNGNDTPKI
jgi:hypothetical protein